jgi:hypothetical protein
MMEKVQFIQSSGEQVLLLGLMKRVLRSMIWRTIKGLHLLRDQEEVHGLKF